MAFGTLYRRGKLGDPLAWANPSRQIRPLSFAMDHSEITEMPSTGKEDAVLVIRSSSGKPQTCRIVFAGLRFSRDASQLGLDFMRDARQRSGLVR